MYSMNVYDVEHRIEMTRNYLKELLCRKNELDNKIFEVEEHLFNLKEQRIIEIEYLSQIRRSGF